MVLGGFPGFRKSRTIAIAWYERSAHREDREAEQKLAEIYEFGEGVRADHEKALQFMRQAAAKFSAASMWLGAQYAQGAGTKKNARLAAEWYQISAEAGHRIAQMLLGELYENESAIQDYGKSAYWYRISSEQWAPAFVDWGRLYEFGKGVPQDYAEAARLYQKAIAKDELSGRYELGSLYERGLGVPKDLSLAMENCHSSYYSHPDVPAHLLELYKLRMGIALGGDRSIDWYRDGVAKGDPWSAIGLGLHYQGAIGVPENRAVAYALFNLAIASEKAGVPNLTGPPVIARQMLERDRIELLQKMKAPGNVLKAIDYYVAHPPPEYMSD